MQAQQILIRDTKANILKGSVNGAAYMNISNNYDVDLQLIGAQCDLAEKVELHDHLKDACGNSQMVMVENITIPAHGSITLKRGNLHLMLMNLKKEAYQSTSIPITLFFLQPNGYKISMEVAFIVSQSACHCNK